METARETYPQRRAELYETGYITDCTFNHADIIPFVKANFFRFNPVIVAYWIFNLVCIVFMLVSALSGNQFFELLNKCFLGFAGFFLLIPFHELVHGIGYYLAGAKKVSYRAVWRKFVFYAMADRFVTHRNSFVALALAPFLLINGALIWAIFISSSDWQAIFSGALIMHSAGCSGDFALVSYFYTHWSRSPVTYDEEAEGYTHFLLLRETRS
jgi:hypothetical protein